MALSMEVGLSSGRGSNVVVIIEVGSRECKPGVVVYILIESDRSALRVISVRHGTI